MASPESERKKMSSEEKKKKRSGVTLEELKKLGRDLISSRAHINNAPILLSFLSCSSPLSHALESLLSLQSFFLPLLSDLPPSKSLSPSSDPLSIYRSWLRSNFDLFLNSLIDIVASPHSDEALKEMALEAVMEIVKSGRGGNFQFPIYHNLLGKIVRSMPLADTVVELLASNYFNYLDVRYFTYNSLEKLINSVEFMLATDNRNVKRHGDGEPMSASSNEEHAIHNIYNILSRIPTLEGQDGNSNHEMWSELGKGDKKTSHGILAEENETDKSKKCDIDISSASKISKKLKTKFTKAWIAFLRLKLPLDLYKEVLGNLYQTVIPHLLNPVILCDFLTRSYDVGGVISVMALSSLFILMTQHGLEYPNFYEKLYGLLVPAIFMAKHRARFFQLLDTCLKSSLLPAHLAAAFAKKLSRVALSVPPSGALVIIAIIHNLLRRHPSINCLVHRDDDENNESASRQGSDFVDNVPGLRDDKPGSDLFNIEEKDPMKSNAMRSSLWEIDSLRHHYCPAVSRFVESLDNDLTVRAKTSEIAVKDFSSGSYATIFGDEIRRRVKNVPLAFYKVTPTSLFSESDFVGWTFGSQHTENEASTVPGKDCKNIAKKRRTDVANDLK